MNNYLVSQKVAQVSTYLATCATIVDKQHIFWPSRRLKDQLSVEPGIADLILNDQHPGTPHTYIRGQKVCSDSVLGGRTRAHPDPIYLGWLPPPHTHPRRFSASGILINRLVNRNPIKKPISRKPEADKTCGGL